MTQHYSISKDNMQEGKSIYFLTRLPVTQTFFCIQCMLPVLNQCCIAVIVILGGMSRDRL